MRVNRSIMERAIRERIEPAIRYSMVGLCLLVGGAGAHSYAVSGIAVDRASTERAAAERALMQGHIDEAVARAQRLAAINPKDGQAYLLMCRSFYAEAHAEEAIDACTKATEALPQSSEAENWLGRAAGMKAERA
jgi:tetratricopeptide (TPR) repeat protein